MIDPWWPHVTRNGSSNIYAAYIELVLIVSQLMGGTTANPVGCMYVCMAITYSKGKDQPGKVANPARGQLNRENEYSPVPVRA